MDSMPLRSGTEIDLQTRLIFYQFGRRDLFPRLTLHKNPTSREAWLRLVGDQTPTRVILTTSLGLSGRGQKGAGPDQDGR
jgi:hypothetical protein